MKVVNIRENPEMKDIAIRYISEKWASDASRPVYDDCIGRSIAATSPLPIWYLLMEPASTLSHHNEELKVPFTDGDEIVGCAGLITNDFISCMDLWPWLCGLYIEEKHRGNAYGSLLIEQMKKDAAKAGFSNIYLATDHIGYYEKYGFEYLCDGYHPWGDSSRVYGCKV